MIRSWSLVCGAVLLCASPAFAQGFTFGVKGGLNVATQDISGVGSGVSLSPRIGLVAGGFVTLRLTSWLDVQPEGLYAMKGTRLKVAGTKSDLNLDYFEVPVLARVRFAKMFYAEAGPSMALRVQAKARSRFSGGTEEVDVSDQVERFDFGVGMGGGLLLGPLVLDGRYTLGLTDVDKDKGDASKTKNRAISVTAGIRF